MSIKGQASPALKALKNETGTFIQDNFLTLKHFFCTCLIFLLCTNEYTLQRSYNICHPGGAHTIQARQNTSSWCVHNKNHPLHCFLQSPFQYSQRTSCCRQRSFSPLLCWGRDHSQVLLTRNGLFSISYTDTQDLVQSCCQNVQGAEEHHIPEAAETHRIGQAWEEEDEGQKHAENTTNAVIHSP